MRRSIHRSLRAFVGFSLLFVGGFFYAQGAGAQTTSKLPDLTITNATLDGAALRFQYHNRGEGEAQPEVSFWYEWIDGQGRRIGEVYWLNASGMRAGSSQEGNQLHDFSTLDFEHGTVKLADLIYYPPPGASHLKLTIDGPNKHAEANEKNNAVILPVLRTDFTITDAEFRNDFPWYKYHNRGNLGHPAGKTISFWFEWVDARGARLGELHWLDVDPPLILSARSASLARSTLFDSTTTVFSAKGPAKLAAFLNSAPNGSANLKITIDGPNAFAEFHEGNNTVLLKKLVNLGADLTIGSVVVRDRALHITARNVGVSDAPMTDVTLMWLGVKSPSVELVTLDPISAGKEMTITISLDGLGGANKMLRDPPEGAQHLRIFLDGNQRLVELNEGNNIAFLDRAQLAAPKPEGEKFPDLALTGGSRSSGVVRVTIVNGTPNEVRAPALQFKWLDAQGATLSTSPVSYWQHESIAPGKTGDFTLEYERWREDGVTYFLKHPPAGTAALLVAIDPENRLQESNEGNNTFRIALSQPDLTLGKVEVRDNALRIEVRNGGAAPSTVTDIWLMWFGAKTSLPSSGVVGLPAIAAGGMATVIVPFEGNTEASRILRDPPKEGTRLLIYLDRSQKVEELDEQNNNAFVERAAFPKAVEPTLLPDLAFTQVMVPRTDDFLVIGFQNAGKAGVRAWNWQVRWLDARDLVVGETYKNTHPGLKAGWRFGVSSHEKEQDTTGTPRPLSQFLRQLPTGAVRIEITLDPDNNVAESDEKNNAQHFEVANFPPSLRAAPKAAPELLLTLSIKVLPSSAVGAAATSSTAAFLLALAALLASAHLIHAHHLPRGGKSGFLAILPMLFISARSSYMRLQGCGPEGCGGPHFSSHQALQGIARSSLLATAFAGVVKVALAAALAIITPVAAGETIVHPGDRLEATLTAKNIGVGRAQDVILVLKCPAGSVRDGAAMLNSRKVSQDPEAGIGAPDLEPGKSHQVATVCKVTADAVRLGQVEFSGSARVGQLASPFVSNTVRLAVKERPKPQPEAVPQDKPDLAIAGMGFLPLLDIVEASNQPLPAIFSAYVKNSGAKNAPASRARLRLDAGGNGSWDFTAPALAEVPILPAGEQTFIKIPFEWKAPVGAYAFEICTDALSAIDESNESNNCATDRFTLRVGEEPAQEEELIAE